MKIDQEDIEHTINSLALNLKQHEIFDVIEDIFCFKHNRQYLVKRKELLEKIQTLYFKKIVDVSEELVRLSSYLFVSIPPEELTMNKETRCHLPRAYDFHNYVTFFARCQIFEHNDNYIKRSLVANRWLLILGCCLKLQDLNMVMAIFSAINSHSVSRLHKIISDPASAIFEQISEIFLGTHRHESITNLMIGFAVPHFAFIELQLESLDAAIQLEAISSLQIHFAALQYCNKMILSDKNPFHDRYYIYSKQSIKSRNTIFSHYFLKTTGYTRSKSVSFFNTNVFLKTNEKEIFSYLSEDIQKPLTTFQPKSKDVKSLKKILPFLSVIPEEYLGINYTKPYLSSLFDFYRYAFTNCQSSLLEKKFKFKLQCILLKLLELNNFNKRKEFLHDALFKIHVDFSPEKSEVLSPHYESLKKLQAEIHLVTESISLIPTSLRRILLILCKTDFGEFYLESPRLKS